MTVFNNTTYQQWPRKILACEFQMHNLDILLPKIVNCDRAQARSWLGAYACVGRPSLQWIRASLVTGEPVKIQSLPGHGMVNLFPLTKQKGERKVDKSSRSDSGANKEDRLVYCGEFQNDACYLQDNHGGQFFRQSVSFQHICATCWKRTKTRAYHPASSMDCPFYEYWLTRSAPGREGTPGASPDDGSVWVMVWWVNVKDCLKYIKRWRTLSLLILSQPKFP